MMDLASKPGSLGRLEFFAYHCAGGYHPVVEVSRIHPLGEGWALDVDHRDRIGDHTAHGSCTDRAGLHALHASGAIWGYEPTGPYSPPRICYESCSVTATQPNSDLQLLGANP